MYISLYIYIYYVHIYIYDIYISCVHHSPLFRWFQARSQEVDKNKWTPCNTTFFRHFLRDLFPKHIPSGKRCKRVQNTMENLNFLWEKGGKSAFLMGQLWNITMPMGKHTISMAIFNSHVSHYQRVQHLIFLDERSH